MTKKQLLSMVAVSSLVLSNASGVLADELGSSTSLGDSSVLVSTDSTNVSVNDGAGVEVSNTTTPVKPVENQGSASDTSVSVGQPTNESVVGVSDSTSTVKPVENQGSASDTSVSVGQPTNESVVGGSDSTSTAKPVENQGSTNGTSLGKESKSSKDATVTDGAGVEVSNSTSAVKPVNKQDSTSTSLGKDSKPSKDATVTDGAGVEVSDSTSTVKPVEKKESSTDKLKLDENKSESSGTVENIGTNAGQVSESTKQVIQDVSYNAPVVLESGYQVVHTQDAVVTALDTVGNTVQTTAENLGGKTNTDGTVSFKTSTGEMKTLPRTGEKTAWWSWIVGIMVILGAVYLGAKDKITELIDKLRGIEYEYVEEDEDDDE